jgi:hypothetical protein
MTKPLTQVIGLCLAAACCVSACGGGGSNASIGGSVAGLGTGLSLTLQDNASDTLTVAANGPFAFGTKLADGSAYTVTVLTQPAGQVCELTNSTGSVDTNGDAVNTVNVVCVNTATLSGTVSGLAAGTAVTLSNGSVLLPLATNGAFAFPGLLTAGTAYQVTVATQPLGLTCTVLNGTGTISSASATAATPITVTCS